MSDAILDALTARAQGGAPAGQLPTGQASGPAIVDPILATLQARAGHPDLTAQPSRSRGFFDQAGDFVSAAAHHTVKGLHGTAQLIENTVAAGAGLLPDNPVSRAIIDTAAADNLAMRNWEDQYQHQTPNSIESFIGAGVGEALPLAVGGVANGLRSVGDAVGSKATALVPAASPRLATTVARLASGATQGAIVGATQPVTNVGPQGLGDLVTGSTGPGYWQQKANDVLGGAATGTVVPMVTGAAKAGWNSAKNAWQNSPLIHPERYAANQVAAQLGEDLPGVVDNLRGAPTYVEGSLPTTAQAGADPRLVMMEKALANQSPDFKQAMLQREIENNSARFAQVGQVARTPEALAAAIDRRASITQPLYQQATQANYPVDSELQDLLDRPAVKQAMGRAETLAKNQGRPFTFFAAPEPAQYTPPSPYPVTAKGIMEEEARRRLIEAQNTSAFSGVGGTKIEPIKTITGQGLQDLKMAMDEMLTDPTSGFTGRAGNTVRDLRGQLVSWLEKTNPAFTDANSQYRTLSQPVNAMQLGQQLQEKLAAGGLNAAGDPNIAFTNYRANLARALDQSEHGIDPVSQSLLEGVQNDLQRSTISNSIRTPGSDTAFNQGAGRTFLNALGISEPSSGFGKMATAGGLTAAVTGSPTAGAGAAAGVKKLGDMTTSRVQKALADLLMSPESMADALEMSPKSAPLPIAPTGGRLTGPTVAAALLAYKHMRQAPQVVEPQGHATEKQ